VLTKNLPKKFTAKVFFKENLSLHFVHLGFLPLDIPSFEYEAGQYISLVVGEGVRRAYSIANWKVEPSGVFELLIDTKSQGVGSEYIKSLNIGDVVEMLGPYGKFTVPQDIQGTVWFLATGSGVAPIKAQIEYLVGNLECVGNVKNIRLLYGTKLEQDLVFFNYFENIAETSDNFYYHLALSTPSESFSPSNMKSSNPLSVWGEYWHKGHITEIAKNLLLKEKPEYVFLCGHPGMMNEATELFTNSGVDPKKILFEKY